MKSRQGRDRENRAKEGSKTERGEGKETFLLGRTMVEQKGRGLMTAMGVRISSNVIIPPPPPEPLDASSSIEGDGPSTVEKCWPACMTTQLPPPLRPPDSGTYPATVVTPMEGSRKECMAVLPFQGHSVEAGRHSHVMGNIVVMGPTQKLGAALGKERIEPQRTNSGRMGQAHFETVKRAEEEVWSGGI